MTLIGNEIFQANNKSGQFTGLPGGKFCINFTGPGKGFLRVNFNKGVELLIPVDII